MRNGRTCNPTVPCHPHSVPALLTPAHVQRLVHVAHPVHKELERLPRAIDALLALSEVAQDMGDVPEGCEYVPCRAALPPVRTGERAGVGWQVVDGVHVVHRRGVSVLRLALDLVGPCCNGCKRAWRVRGGRGEVEVWVEDVTDVGEDGFGEVDLGNGCDDLVPGGAPGIYRGRCTRENRDERECAECGLAHSDGGRDVGRLGVLRADRYIVFGVFIQAVPVQPRRLYGKTSGRTTAAQHIKGAVASR